MINPLFVHIELTQNCPLNCNQCYVKLDNYNELDWEMCKNIIYQLKDIDVSQILLTGGEPLLYHKLIDCIKLIRSCNIFCSMSSSGFGLNEELCENLKQADINEIYISLNGSSAEIHNKSRSHFEFAIDAIQMIKKYDIFCGINWVARHDNFMDFAQLYKFTRTLGVDKIVVLSNKKSTDGIVHSELDFDEVDILLKNINSIRDSEHVNYIDIDPCFTSLINKSKENRVTYYFNQFNGGKSFFDILSNGNFTPCRHLCLAGKYNISNTSLKNYWNNSNELSYYRNVHSNYKHCQM